MFAFNNEHMTTSHKLNTYNIPKYQPRLNLDTKMLSNPLDKCKDESKKRRVWTGKIPRSHLILKGAT